MEVIMFVKIVNGVYWILIVVSCIKIMSHEGGWTLAVAIFAPMILSYFLGVAVASQNMKEDLDKLG